MSKDKNPECKSSEEDMVIVAKKSVFGGKLPKSEEDLVKLLQSHGNTLIRYIECSLKMAGSGQVTSHAEQALNLKNNFDKVFWEWYGSFTKRLSDSDAPVCPQCGFILIPTTTILTDGKTQDGQNYVCRYCHANHPSKIKYWHMYFSDGKIEAGNVNTAY